jgi:energy-coupling factor transporter ATP-binding protein EcfA2
MKLKHVLIDNFKGLRHLEMDLSTNDGVPRNLTCLLGDNGSGKTTVLQAIALTLSEATRRTRSPFEFRWHGFLPERVDSLGPTFVKLTVEFDAVENTTTQTLFQHWLDAQPTEWRQTHRVEPPSNLRQVELVYEGGRVYSPQGFAAKCQFLGRYYVKWLAKTTPAWKDQFGRVGDVFWFDQYRNLGTVFSDQEPERRENSRGNESWGVGVELLREYLVGWWAYAHSQIAPDRPDRMYLRRLERTYAELFPGTRFRGTMPREGVAEPSAKDFYFLIERAEKLYDLAEMSSGEQAIFSLLYDFIRLNIARSVVLIDELELHLHAPAQQGLLAALPKLGHECQFIVTTHSEFLTGVIPDEQEVRLEGGRRCL